MELLFCARKGGVIPPVDLRDMIKPKDRCLWNCISSVAKTRRVSPIEASGCFAHWLVERRIGRPLPKPEVTAAVDGLYKALKIEIILEQIEND